MATTETAQTTDANPHVIYVETAGDGPGVIQNYIHWTAFTSASECANGEAVLFWAKDSMTPPVVKSSANTTISTGYASPIAVSAAVSGNDCQVVVTGLAGKTIDWQLRITS